MQEFAHGGNNHLHRALTMSDQAVTECGDHRVVSFSCESRHVEGLTQENIAGLRNGGFPCPLARLADTGIESCIGDQLFGRVKSL